MNQRAIGYIILAVIGIPMLIQIGTWSATDPIYSGVSALLVIGLIVLTQLGLRCWLLIPFFASFGGSLNILPGHFAPQDLAVGIVALILPLMWTVRRFPIRIKIGALEISYLVLIAFIGQAYVRNPVGLSIFGSGTIGGRPYFEIAISAVSFVLLSVLVVDLKSVRTMVYANFAGSIIVAAYQTILGLFPFLAYYSNSIYSIGTTGISAQQHISVTNVAYQGSGRMKFLGVWGQPLLVMALVFKTPLQLLNPRNLGFGFMVFFAGVAVLLSGFRSELANIGFLTIAAVFLHRKPVQILVMGVVAAPLLALVLVLQGSLIDFPLPIQRTLSFLPGDWSNRATVEAEGSTEWRIEMWREALSSDRYIRNKLFGDGFGFTAREMDYQYELMTIGVSGADKQDFYLATGTYHSGPVETIKRIGYVGLAVLLIVMGVVFKHAVTMVNRTRDTPYYPYAMFVALPLVVHPFMFILVFGAFKVTLSILFVGGGSLRLLGNSFEDWRRKQAIESEK